MYIFKLQPLQFDVSRCWLISFYSGLLICQLCTYKNKNYTLFQDAGARQGEKKTTSKVLNNIGKYFL